MFEDNEYDYSPKSYVEFRYVSRNERGEEDAKIIRKLHGEDCEYLPKLLEAFHYFLMGMTFTYVDGVVAVNQKGDDCASSFEI
jgi:hypothetical protein